MFIGDLLHDRKCSEKVPPSLFGKMLQTSSQCNSVWVPTRHALSPQLKTEGKEGGKKKKRNVLGESKLFQRHKPQTYQKSFTGYQVRSFGTMSIPVLGVLDWQ